MSIFQVIEEKLSNKPLLKVNLTDYKRKMIFSAIQIDSLFKSKIIIFLADQLVGYWSKYKLEHSPSFKTLIIHTYCTN